MAKKRKLSDLIGEETQQVKIPQTEVTDSVSTKVPNSVTSEITELQTTEVTNSSNLEDTELQTDKVTDSVSTEVPKYLTLVRKEARLHSSQLDKLTSLTRSLNRQRKGSGERITENTLIRVAIDLLLERGDELKGTTERELKKSVGL